MVNIKTVGMTDKLFVVPVFLVRLGGIPVNMHKVPKLNCIYNGILAVCYYGTYLSVIMDFVNKREDIQETMKNVRMIFGMAVVAWMHLYLRYIRRDIDYLIHLAESFNWEILPTRDPDSENVTMNEFMFRVGRLTKFAWALTIVFHGTQSALRMLTSHSMVFTTWYPFDASISPIYEIANLKQGLASLLIISLSTGFPGLYATFICVACSQLEKLRATILDMRQTRVTSEQDRGAETDQEETQGQVRTSEEVFHHMQKQLNYCIRHHQQIKRYMTALEDTMNFMFCGLFLILLAALCIIAFSAVTSWGDFTDVSQALVMYVILLCNVFVFCWLGSQLSEQLVFIPG
ncbi:uncharacterized protein LOC110833823 isoform X2 [Zootermopsis nevadensis]|uniref:uncharacterized protein LOC110833823 isoform X2 n=1 Tax=Zootermopsis nevadensis TaxID=136037 RepID=UPI000B8E665D|nr:uncharacterized protein LOC110833823 isoform X2 [Zootermopsis nevadensis]